MVKEMSISALRKLMGIKKLKNKIPMSEFEKAVIIGLREHEKRRITHEGITNDRNGSIRFY